VCDAGRPYLTCSRFPRVLLCSEKGAGMDVPVRFVGLDVHKHYIMAAALDATLKVILSPRKIPLEQFPEWAHREFRVTDAVVLEATTNAWELVDLLVPLVHEVKVAHPLLVKLISSARVKTDTKDTIHLARLLAAGLIPEVWVPPPPVRELRALVAHRQRLVRQRTQARNRMQSVLHAHNLVPPPDNPFAETHQQWWDTVPLPLMEKLRIRQDLVIFREMERLLKEVDEELHRLSVQDPWLSSVPFVLQLPGFGIINSMTLLAAIGDITRFPSAQKLVGYSGLGASVHASGQKYETGRITKQGRREMRSALIESAWMAVQFHPEWKERFNRLSSRIGKGKAIVAIARKLLVILWHVLTNHSADRNALAPAVARKFIRWAKEVGKEHRYGHTMASFAREHLNRIQVGRELTSVEYGGKPYRLVPNSA
jgi:transposase